MIDSHSDGGTTDTCVPTCCSASLMSDELSFDLSGFFNVLNRPIS